MPAFRGGCSQIGPEPKVWESTTIRWAAIGIAPSIGANSRRSTDPVPSPEVYETASALSASPVAVSRATGRLRDLGRIGTVQRVSLASGPYRGETKVTILCRDRWDLPVGAFPTAIRTVRGHGRRGESPLVNSDACGEFPHSRKGERWSCFCPRSGRRTGIRSAATWPGAETGRRSMAIRWRMRRRGIGRCGTT
jgi:hypothetical protein